MVRDSSGAVVEATVTARLIETGRELHTTTDVEGFYQLPVLQVGRYETSASAAGFTGVPRSVRLEVGRKLTVDLKLAVEAIQTTVEVEDSTPLVEETAATVAMVTREPIEALPLNQREFLQLALLAGGAHPAAPGSELERQNDSGLHLNGAREASNNFLLDGVDNNDLYINRLVVSPPLDSIREFRLYKGSYQAELGRSGGGQVNVVSRAGTDELHGSFYEYLRNDAMDARNFFDPAGQPIPKFQRNQFGASIGGPIRKKRAFFFGGYEGARIRDAVTRTARVPTVEELAGDFSAALGRPVIDPFTQAPFPQNRIPAARLDPGAASLAHSWPAPNRPDPAQNLVATPVGDGLVNQLYGRVDLNASDFDTLYVRYNLSHDRSLAPFGDGNTNVPGFGSFALNRGQNLAVSGTRILSPNAVSETRFGFNRLRREIRHQNSGIDVASALGIAGLSTNPDFVGFPAINVPGYDNIGDATALPILRQDNTYHVIQALTVVRGHHTFKLGGEFRAVTVDGIQGLFGRGQLNFLGALTTNPLSDFVLGLPTYTIQTTIDNPFRQRAQSWNGYAQDDWRASPRLTLSLGLRYELNRPAVDADDRFTYFDLERRDLVPAGTGALGRAGYKTDVNNFAPRLGVSWNPSSNLVIRGGYGVFHDITILEANSGLYFNPPYFDLRIFFPSERQLLTLADPFPTGAGFTPLPSANSIQPDLATGYVQQWNGGVEKALGAGVVLRASYVGSKGTKLLRRRDLNQPSPAEGDVDARRPIPGFANVVLFESGSSSIYHSGVLTLERRYATGVAFSASYTVSKSIDDNSAFLDSDGDQGFPQNSRDFAAERGLSSFDQRQRFVFSGSYELPFRNPVARDWTVYAITAFGSGRPFTPALSVDNSNTGNSGSIFGQDRPDAIGSPFTRPSTPERWFNVDAFAASAPFTFGNAGRNVLIGPGTATVDLAVVRRFSPGERAHIDLRAEAFNLANRANFDLPRRFADQPTFGRILSAGAARQFQLGLRIEY